ncbi:Tn3 family transposase [Congregibacter litoralis]|uniref:Transposase, TnpA family n=1 Tax=Congregibacter litoralis KT71 TaxID=314285 RepID=A4ABD3_9GAMM|nr:Tn3 family transposase [Congregibacter litoralis]EAQ96687.2 Transposase, TnpA family [Congregibacter litoralis KT71]
MVDTYAEDFLPQGHRLQILTPEEYELLWGFPTLTATERELFFSTNRREQTVFELARTPRTRLHFRLLLGYFKARQRFFVVDEDAMGDDIRYLAELLDVRSFDIQVSKHTRQLHVSWILELFGYSLLDDRARLDLETRALEAARISSRPVYVLRDLVDYLRQQRIVLPGYTYLQDVVRRALVFERDRLSDALAKALSADDRRRLDALLRDDEGLHAITSIKHPLRDFSHRQLLNEIDRGERLQGLYGVAQRVIGDANLSVESVRFYASLVDYYTVYKLKRMKRQMTRLYLLCFVRDRYQRLHDHLIAAFCSLLRCYVDEVNETAKEAFLRYRREANDDLDQGAKLLHLFIDPEIQDAMPFGEVRAAAAELLPADRIARLCDYLVGEQSLDEAQFEWDAVDALMPKVKRNLRPLIRFLRWSSPAPQHNLIESCHHLADAFVMGHQVPSNCDLSWVPDRHRRYVMPQGVLHRDRYEFLLYRVLRDRIEAGDVYCTDSARYRSFEDDLVDAATWAHRDTLLPKALPSVTPISSQLAELKDTLSSRFDAVNERIRRGENSFVHLRDGQVQWNRTQGADPDSSHEPLFDTAERIDIDQLLLYVDRKTGFLSAFEHVMGRYQRERASPPLTIAALMAFATNIGVGRMAEISNLTRAQLSGTATNFLRLETLKEANDRIANATARQPIFKHYDIGDTVHSSSDGQKFESAIPTVNSRHSSKYFGLKKGVVAYTLLASHVPLSARIIGANEHESHYVFDVLFNNLTDIQPDTHSTDTHGTNQVNFALLHLFGYRFAPRYRDFRRKAQTGLYAFKPPNAYAGCAIKPVRRIKESLIESEWENIERILLSLALKTTSQSVIVSKLSSHRRQNRTKQALWEFEHIIRSLYLLDYVDSPLLRRNVHRALNRGEAYHRLRRAIAYAHGGRFRVRSQHEQELWNECTRLIANAVVYYNSEILSELLQTLVDQSDHGAIDTLQRVTPLAWQHINFYGRYRFDEDLRPVNLAQMAKNLAKTDARSWGMTA